MESKILERDLTITSAFLARCRIPSIEKGSVARQEPVRCGHCSPGEMEPYQIRIPERYRARRRRGREDYAWILGGCCVGEGEIS